MPKQSTKQKKSVYKLPSTNSGSNYLGKIEKELESNQSKVSMVLGGLIILVIGVLIFNNFNKNKSTLGPAQQTEEQAQTEDVLPENLPGNYMVKEGDTLFTIAEKYYRDGSKFTEIASTNSLPDVNVIEKDQILNIPKLETSETVVEASTQPSVKSLAQPEPKLEQPEMGKGGADTTIWGAKIEGNEYIVAEGDWLSTISARAYGDIYAYEKIANANNIANPDLILPGTVLTIPR